MNLDPLLHMLGLDERHAEPWRNHYVTSAADSEIAQLVGVGLVEEMPAPAFLRPGDRVYRATQLGIDKALAEHSHRFVRPAPSRGHARYLAWLNASDAYGVSFSEFLRRRLYEETP